MNKRKYFIDDKEIDRIRFYGRLGAVLYTEAFASVLEEQNGEATEQEVIDAHEKMLKVAKQLLNENYEVYVSDRHFRIEELEE